MKKYLEDLEKELKKMGMSNTEIDEIIKDHVEMLGEAKEDGLTDDDLVEKFGYPEDVAKELSQDERTSKVMQKEKVVIKEGILEGYELIKAFPVVEDVKEVIIKFVNEDLKFIPHDGESIEIFAKKLKDIEDYNISLHDGIFNISREKQSGFNLFGSRSSSVKFGVKMPRSANFDDFNVTLVSGDSELFDIKSKDMTIKTTSGDIELSNVEVKNDAKFNVVSGDIKVVNLQANELEISSVSGDLKVRNVDLYNELYVNTVSGDVDAKNVNAKNVAFKSVSGDFEGQEVYVDTVKSSTVSGDFEIKNLNHDQEIVVTKQKSLSGKVKIK